MQKEFKLSPLNPVIKYYHWENGAWPEEEQGIRYAVLYREKIIAIFDTLHWSKEFVKNTNLTLKIMKVDE
jgi:hypothetical protein